MELSFRRRDKEINKVLLLPVEEITSNPNQPRKHFDPGAMAELCQSIQSNGLLQPITVRRLEGNRYELIAGERRLKAFRLLEKVYIPAIVEEFTDEQSAVLSLIENLQRRDLNFFEEADGIARLIRELDLTQQQASQKLGKAQSTIANKLRLLRYPMDARKTMLQAGLTERHARALLKLPDPADSTVLEYVVTNRLNVEQTEEYVRQLLSKDQKSKASRTIVIKDMRIFLNSVNKAVKIMQSAGIPVASKKTETEEFVEMVITVPKRAVYRKPQAASL